MPKMSIREQIRSGRLSVDAAKRFASGASSGTKRKWDRVALKGSTWSFGLGRLGFSLFIKSAR